MLAASLVLHVGLLIVCLACSIAGLVRWNNDNCHDGEIELLAGTGCLCLGLEIILAAIQSGYTDVVAYICPGFFVAVGLIYLLVGTYQVKTRNS